MPACYKCGQPYLHEALTSESICEKCSSWLHSCANCVNYDEYANQKCREPRAPYIYDRHGKNSCPFFKVRQVLRNDKDNKKVSPRGEQSDREGKAREGLERLFKS